MPLLQTQMNSAQIHYSRNTHDDYRKSTFLFIETSISHRIANRNPRDHKLCATTHHKTTNHNLRTNGVDETRGTADVAAAVAVVAAAAAAVAALQASRIIQAQILAAISCDVGRVKYDV